VNLPLAEKIADAVLYEGYILYPYRPSAVKNQQRWTFGGVYPRTYSEAQNGADAWFQVIECLAKGDAQSALDIKVRFLHLVQREVQVREGETFRVVESLRVGDKVFHTWQEAITRAVTFENIRIGEIAVEPKRFEFSFPAMDEVEKLSEDGVFVRTQQEICGGIELTAQQIGDALKLTIHVSNLTAYDATAEKTRDDAVKFSFASTHSILGIHGGEFISLMDPPEEYREPAKSCHNIGVYPILVGDQGERDLMLASPIILYDYPEIAPESAGDLFDGTEIDEILSLRILTLTDEEKQEARDSDERARAILDRTENLPPEVWARLHGAMRGLKPVSNNPVNDEPVNNDLVNLDGADAFDFSKWDISGADEEADRVRLERITIRGVEVKTGDQVRLQPKGGADAFDILLKGHIATIEAIEQDFESKIYLAVTVDDDPGKDFGRMRQAAHRFFFTTDEVEPVNQG